MRLTLNLNFLEFIFILDLYLDHQTLNISLNLILTLLCVICVLCVLYERTHRLQLYGRVTSSDTM